MPRHHAHWLDSFLEYTDYAESPREMRFWAGVSAVAGALRRRVWFSQYYYTWYPSFYIILVAPPGVVSKSTTAGMATRLLREVPGIHFGPDVATWQSLLGAFAGVAESFEYEGDFKPMSALTIAASELGSLIDPHDGAMINFYIDMWDGLDKYDKITKTSGNEVIEAPVLNLIGCTTPAWISNNMDLASVGGGFASRCVFVYAERKAKYVAYPGFEIAEDMGALRQSLIDDLAHIASVLVGPFTITPDAIAWGQSWYRNLGEGARPEWLKDEKLDGYLARKQAHLHKLAMVISAAQRDDLTLTPQDLIDADRILTATEQDMSKVFARIGKSEASIQLDGVVAWLELEGSVPLSAFTLRMQTLYPKSSDITNVMKALVESKRIKYDAVSVTFVGTPTRAPRSQPQ